METDPNSVFIPPVRVIAVRIFTPHLQKFAPVIKDSREENKENKGKQEVSAEASAEALDWDEEKNTPNF